MTPTVFVQADYLFPDSVLVNFDLTNLEKVKKSNQEKTGKEKKTEKPNELEDFAYQRKLQNKVLKKMVESLNNKDKEK